MKNKIESLELKLQKGCRISLHTGELESNHLDRMSTLRFYHAYPGDEITLLDYRYQFAVGTYDLEYDEKYMYTYDYQKEENWTTYRGDLNADSYQQNSYVFSEEVYFRINIKRIDDCEFSEEEAKYTSSIVRWKHTEENQKNDIIYLEKEIIDTKRQVNTIRTEDSLSLLLLTDSHYTVNGTWLDTKNSIQKLSHMMGLDGIVHMGDCTDGMVSREVTIDYVNEIQNDLKESGNPLYYILGNHDSNYFHNNPDKFTQKEMVKIYLDEQPSNVVRKSEHTYYYADFQKQRIRCILLDSFDYREEVRYGFSEEELIWLEDVLNTMSKGWGCLLFSHVPPIPRLHYWSDKIRGSEKLIRILKRFQDRKDCELIAFIHGHNHADQIDIEEGFPIVSIGCAKCEYFTDKKPEGSRTYERKRGTATQELWDVLVVSRKEKCLDFIRFGAGENRRITWNK